ncbi:hypothetical protein C1N55_05190 [Lysinibacillus sp. SGAir0095]|nr:hypothetical protein C1N55_05190 [Lysinibacillus sp. SGAir0095]
MNCIAGAKLWRSAFYKGNEVHCQSEIRANIKRIDSSLKTKKAGYLRDLTIPTKKALYKRTQQPLKGCLGPFSAKS